MNTGIVLSCLSVITAITAGQAANLDSALLARYVCRSRADYSKVMVPGSCTQYYLCEDGKAKLNTCPNFYDAINQQCVTKNPGCVETFRDVPICSGPCCGVSDNDYAVDPINPAVYYLCRDDCVAEEHVCQNGLMFDLVQLECSSASTCSDCTTRKPPCETTTTTCEPTTTTCTTTTPCTTTTTRRTTTPKPRVVTTTTTRRTTTRTTTTTCTTTTTTCTTTTPCTTTTTCLPTTTTCPTTTTKAPCKQETITTTCITTTTPCITTKAPCKESENRVLDNNGLMDPSHYVLPSKISQSEILDYAQNGCVNKPDGYLLPSLTKCNEYFICRNSNALPVSCGKKYFNIKTDSCDWPSNTGCIQANLV